MSTVINQGDLARPALPDPSVCPCLQRGGCHFHQGVVRGVLPRGLYDVLQRGARDFFLGVRACIRAGAEGQSDLPLYVEFLTATVP